MIRLMLFTAALLPSLSWAAITLQELHDRILQQTSLKERIVEETLTFYSDHYQELRNPNYITIVDFNKHSGNRRFYLIRTEDGSVESLHTAHGKGSDVDNDGIAESFSNISESHKSSLGFTITGETYQGNNGYSLRLYSMEPINSRIYDRAIVVHGAEYVSPDRAKMGRSFGCPALPIKNYREVIDKIKDGSLFYFFHDQIDEARRNPSILNMPDSEINPDWASEKEGE